MKWFKFRNEKFGTSYGWRNTCINKYGVNCKLLFVQINVLAQNAGHMYKDKLRSRRINYSALRS